MDKYKSMSIHNWTRKIVNTKKIKGITLIIQTFSIHCRCFSQLKLANLGRFSLSSHQKRFNLRKKINFYSFKMKNAIKNLSKNTNQGEWNNIWRSIDTIFPLNLNSELSSSHDKWYKEKIWRRLLWLTFDSDTVNTAFEHW